MSTDDHAIHGRSGPPVLLLPGGAEACDGFFPGLVEGLVADPGCRVIVHDRPGTGTSSRRGTLATASSDLNAFIEALDYGPVIVVGQSLGGAVALLLAVDHPEAVAGMVLLDPTPINDARVCARLERVMRVIGRVSAVPVGGGALRALVRAETRRTMRRSHLRPDCQEAIERIGDVDLVKLAAATTGIGRLSADFREDRLPDVPAVLITADRKDASPVARAHSRIAAALGAPVVCWPGAGHNVQLDHPEATLDAVRGLIARTSLAH